MTTPKTGSKRPEKFLVLTITSSRSTQNWNKNGRIASTKNSIANPVRNKNPFKMSALIIILCLIIGGRCSFHRTPLNAAKRIGDTVVMRCCTNENVDRQCGNLTWVRYKPNSPSEFDAILMLSNVSNKFSDHISLVNSSDGDCDLKIKVQTSSDAGRYECTNTSTGEIASAELVVLDSDPECVVKTNDDSYSVTCSVRFVGNWAPEINWSGQGDATIEETASDSPDREIRRTVTLPRTRKIDGKETGITNYRCTVKFTGKGRPDGITATNVPDYKWTSIGFGA